MTTLLYLNWVYDHVPSMLSTFDAKRLDPTDNEGITQKEVGYLGCLGFDFVAISIV